MAQSRSIRHQLSHIIMWTTATAVLIASFVSGVQDFLDERSDLQRALSGVAEMICANGSVPLTFGDQKTAVELLTILRTMPSASTGCIYTKEGKVFAEYRRESNVNLPLHPGPDGFFLYRDREELVRGITLDGQRVGTVYIVSDLRDLHERMAEDVEVMGGMILVSLLAAFLISWRLQKTISEPIVALARVATQVSAEGDYRVRVHSETAAATEEISEMIAGFNAMLAEIEKRDAALLLNRADLEVQVELRTAELSVTNEELTVARDNAERTALINAELSRSNQLILDTAADGILGIDLKGCITFINPAAARFIGWSGNEVVGQGLHDIVHRAADGTRCDIATCATGKSRRSANAVHLRPDTFWRKDGSSFSIEFSTMPIFDESGVHQASVITFHDTTERRAIERMKDEFVSTVSHELRTPLTSIRGALGLLSSGMLGDLPSKGQRMLQIAVTNTDRLVRLINDILDLERVDAGKVELIRSVITADELMIESIEGVQSMADAAGVSIARIPVEASIVADRDRILQTLTNLLSNSIKFSPAGTTITLSGAMQKENFTFRVADQGRGIPADKMEAIFDRFKQVDASDSRDKGGSGLGLAISRSIVNAHGGRIWVESHGGKGSLFQFTLPLPAPVVADEPSAAPRTLLVCHEDQSSMQAMMKMLDANGFCASGVTNAEVLCTRASEVHPDAIVLDLAGNGVNGWQIVEMLKSCPGTRDIPIVVTTASPESCERFAAAITSWVQKPLDQEELIHAVSAACAAASPTILIVEDDLDLAKVMTAALEAHGIRIVHAATGGEAIEAARHCEPSLIVLDLVLPDTSGYAVVESMRSDAALRRIPLLVYSALEVGVADQERLKLGPTEFMTKSRGTLSDFETHVVRLLKTVTAPAPEVPNAA
jgi:PAS domain S-box-containing protein